MRNKTKAIKVEHIHAAQDIEIIGAKGWDLAEKFGVILHIAAFVLGILTLLGIAFNAKIEHSLEITTLVVIGLILLQALVKPIIKKIFLHNNLAEIWGDSRIKNTTYTIDGTTITKNYKHSIKAKEEMITEENIHLGWYKKKWYKRQKFVFQIFDENNEILISFLPRIIIIDMELKHIKLSGYMTFPGDSENRTRESNIEFKLGKRGQRVLRNAKWYGNFPDYPVYGKFTWTDKKVKLSEKGKERRGNE